MENKGFFSGVLPIDFVNRFELFDRDRVTSDRYCQADPRHPIGLLLSGDVDVGPPTAIVPMIAAKAEALFAQPFKKWCVALFQRLVTDQKGFRPAPSDAQRFFFHVQSLLFDIP